MMIKIKHISQPTGNTCGPTCLKMVFNYIRTKSNSGKMVFGTDPGIDPANPNNPIPIWVNNFVQENPNIYTIATYTNNSGVLVEATIDIISELAVSVANRKNRQTI